MNWTSQWYNVTQKSTLLTHYTAIGLQMEELSYYNSQDTFTLLKHHISCITTFIKLLPNTYLDMHDS